jgi:subtilisin family serine protease
MIVVALISLALLVGCHDAAAGTNKLSPGLEARLQASAPDQSVTAVVFLQEQANIAELDQQLREIRVTRAYRHRVVMENLRATAERSQTRWREYLDQAAITKRLSGYRFYWIVNALVVQAQSSFLYELSRNEDVQYMDVNLKPQLIEPVRPTELRGRSTLDLNQGIPRGVRAINAPRVWRELGITGAGRLVANLDTGVDGGHPALAARWRGVSAPRAQCWLDLNAAAVTPTDGYGHGTHTMGTICGNSTTSNDSVGVAPGAQWIACRATDESGGSELDNDILTAFQWLADPDENPQTIEDVPDVVSNSWGVSPSVGPYTWCFNLWNDAIINCEAAGVVVLFSAGNSGSSGLVSPATVALDSVTNFAVGAVDATNDTIPPYDIAGFSSRGPSGCPPDTAVKPEVCAPGVNVYSCAPGGEYAVMSGTSMAAPHVAGIVALMREASPDADVREIKSALMRSAVDQGDTGNDNTFGFGMVDAFAAVQMLPAGSRGFITGVVSADAIGNPVAGALVRIVETDRGSRASLQGRYFLSLPVDSLWHVQFSAFSFVPIIWPVTVTVGDTTFHNVALASAPTGTISGWILTGASIPVEHAIISLTGTPVVPISTDSAGHFSMQVPGDSTSALYVEYHDAQLDTHALVATGQNVSLTLRLQSPRVAACGPDNYGYRSFDRYDSIYAPRWDWVEIAPSLGGPGALLSLPARDYSAWVAMPFPFRFYGQSFDSLTINENGWLAPGVSHDHSFLNWPIPGASGPSGMLAALWYNLTYPATAELCYWHDSTGGRLIVEYHNLNYAPSSSMGVDFQVHIISTETRPTPTGDCEVVYLYRRVDLSELCTVGIENPSETVGLQLLFNGFYRAASWQIGQGAAIRFSTRARAEYGALNGEITAHPPLADLSVAELLVGGRVIHPSADGDFFVDSLLTGTYHPRLALAGYECDTLQTVISAGGLSAIHFEIWRLDPPRDLTASVTGREVELRWRPPAESAPRVHLDALRDYSVWRDGARMGSTADTAFTDASVPDGDYVYRITTRYDGGESEPSDSVSVHVPASAADAHGGMPQEFALEPCRPNPFNPSTVVEFDVPHAARVRVAVFDVLGRHVTDLVEATVPAGHHSVHWDCSSCSSGLYWVVMQSDGFHAVMKAILIR